MKPHSDFVNYLLELLEDLENVRAKRMFGGYGIFKEDLMFGLVADEVLYLKVDDQIRADFEALGLGPFVYQKQDKAMAMSYSETPPEALDSSEDLLPWAEKAYAAAQRNAKLKRKKKKKDESGSKK